MDLETKNINGKQSQHGFVSIIVASLIMVILSLITIGFTRIMQREQRQALDRQLSRQALYAAESGINDVYSSLQSDPSLPAEKDTCDVTVSPAINKGLINDSESVGYTCVLYDKTPTELVYTIGTGESKFTELKTESGSAFSQIKIRWASEQGKNNVDLLPDCGSATIFPSKRPEVVPLIRLDLTNTTTLTRDGLINGTDYLYLSPCKNGSAGVAHNFNSTAAKGQVVEVACVESQTSPCEIEINGLSSATYAARIKPVYESTTLVISATDVDNNAVEFKQAQTSIDITAKASDVVRRLRVSIPLAIVENPPEAVFQSFDGVCKQMSVDSVSATPRVDDLCN
ncbi:MAG: pilus assembly PilX N-terminal domain-containing protein [Candidatus Saccharibacteria bacterium]|nr:pilus assembly PilX N-terminal domain-containing protein [Candidatus Saccharibacteria bacterium]